MTMLDTFVVLCQILFIIAIIVHNMNGNGNK